VSCHSRGPARDLSPESQIRSWLLRRRAAWRSEPFSGSCPIAGAWTGRGRAGTLGVGRASSVRRSSASRGSPRSSCEPLCPSGPRMDDRDGSADDGLGREGWRLAPGRGLGPSPVEGRLQGPQRYAPAEQLARLSALARIRAAVAGSCSMTQTTPPPQRAPVQTSCPLVRRPRGGDVRHLIECALMRGQEAVLAALDAFIERAASGDQGRQ
jgi:hypothetical protein